ncbi:MAG: zinc-binding dehydrogenase [Paracoccaceae bacterium]|nr:zinc-binding dehydrogenase [Paracoccaceae bacterium]
MKAFTHSRYGPPSVLHLQEIATPRPGASEILIRVHATTVSSGDHRARALTARGRLLLVNSSLGDMLRAPFVSRRNGKKLMAGVALADKEILETLAGLVAQGHFTPVIDWIYPFSEMRKAHAHVDTGHKRGSVVISLIHDEPAHLPHVIAN